MEQSIAQLAEDILASKKAEDERIFSKINKERAEKEAAILESFKSAFADLVPLLEKEGITISAHFKTAWEYQGSYIHFRKGKYLSLRMDYHSPDSFRLEYTKPGQTGRMVYGSYSKPDFILFIYNGMLKPGLELRAQIKDIRNKLEIIESVDPDSTEAAILHAELMDLEEREYKNQ